MIEGLVLAVDPDPQGGSWVRMDPNTGKLLGYGWRTSIVRLCEHVHEPRTGFVVVENLQSFGMPAGASMFETAKRIGELRCESRHRVLAGFESEFDDSLSRPKIKAALCHSAKAKDANVRAALIDLYGGDKPTAIGLKATPGPLYGVSKDVWAALAVGVVWMSLRGGGPLATRDSIQEQETVLSE